MRATRWQVAVVGAGAAGLMAATGAAQRGLRTLLLEKNPRPGSKILISGGGRCNVTHDGDARGILSEFGRQGKFLHSALAAMGPESLRALLAEERVPTRVEPETGKVFPRSDDARDVLDALLRRLRRSGCATAFDEPLLAIAPAASGGFRLRTARGDLHAERVVLAVGGRSYPGCGTTGDGYGWAAALGHTIVTPRPALVPLRTDAAWITSLAGITVPDAIVRVLPDAEHDAAPAGRARASRKAFAQRRGAVLLTHFGLSGPTVLDVSRHVGAPPPDGAAPPPDERGETASRRGWRLQCDWLPAIAAEELDARLAEAASTDGRRLVPAILGRWLPMRLAEMLARRAGVADDRRAAELTRGERASLVEAVKRLDVPITGTLGFRKAEVTAGGVALDQIDSRTMQSRLTPGLYFAGELLDLDGPIGGYNLQAALSTGWLAGQSV